MRESPQFNKLGLVMTKTDATARKEVGILEQMADKVKSDKNYKIPDGYKQIEETHKFIEYTVPKSIPMRKSKRISAEILDDLISSLFGIHFLEPIQSEKVILKVVPDIISRRKHSVNPDVVTTIIKDVSLRQEQEIHKKEYDQIRAV